MTRTPQHLRYAHLDNPIGVDGAVPRLSWTTPGEEAQRAYELQSETDGLEWSSGRVESPDSVLVAYAGPATPSGRRTRWRVRVWTASRVSQWSDWAFWERGLDAGDWTASWIAPFETEPAPPGVRPTHILRSEFGAPVGIVSARLYLTAHGIYEAHLNGARVGDAELTPGYTEYGARLQVQAYDVTDLVRPGERNALAVELSDGWYRGKVGLFRLSNQWGDSTALLGQLHLELENGTTTVVRTSSEWRSLATNHLADLIDGESVDLRDDTPAVMTAGYDTSSWSSVIVETHGVANLVASPAPAVRRVQELVPASITRLDAERQVIDLGQNISGWLRIANLGPAGTRITLTHGEVLDTTGDVTQVNLEVDVPMIEGRLPAGQIDHAVSNGDSSAVFEPRHSTHGFRYVRVEGVPHDLTPDDVRGIVVHTDLRRTGEFECSDESLNRLHDAAVWSFRGNAVDIPTDCPQRERAGFTGDWQIFFPAASFLYDVAGFSTKWLRDVAASQWENGAIPNIAPAPRGEMEHPVAGRFNGSAGWGDAAILVPWQQYVAYGDISVLEENWPMMVRWIRFARAAASTQRHPSRVARDAEPKRHERYIWDSGFHWGEWLEPLAPGQEFDFMALMQSDKGAVATAYFRHSTHLMSLVAAALGKRRDAQEYAELSERIREAWVTEFVDEDGLVTPATQANCVRALTFSLVPIAGRKTVADQLARLVRDNDDHLGTGFLSTGMLLPALADNGHADLAFTVLQQRSLPSWLGMLEAGATTMWERWEGYDPAGQPFESHNHFSKGAVISFLHRFVAGIRPNADAPGYRRFEIHPVPGGGITSARGRLETPYGVVESSWRVTSDTFSIDIVVPAGTSCRLVLPSGLTHGVLAGRHHFAELLPSARTEDRVPA